MKSAGLRGFGVLVTRPQHQAADLVAAIEAAGGEAIQFPVIDIEPLETDIVAGSLRTLPPPDITIFVSVNSVLYGLQHVDGGDTAIAAIGPATKTAIESAGRNVAIFSARGFDSERLLEEPALQNVAGKKIRIIRGAGGRELLADTLRDRGATVHYLAVYRRSARAYSAGLLAGLEHRWRDGQVNCVIAMSVESLSKLLEILPIGCREMLGNTPLVTPSVRVLETASDKLPESTVCLADSPRTDDMVRALIACRQAESG